MICVVEITMDELELLREKVRRDIVSHYKDCGDLLSGSNFMYNAIHDFINKRSWLIFV